MTAAKINDADFIRLFEGEGASELARRVGCLERQVYSRRARLELKIGRRLLPPGLSRGSVSRIGAAYPQRVGLDVENGMVLVGSDAHYWPGEPSTAHRAFLWACKEFKPKAVVMNGDVIDACSISRHPPIGWDSQPTVQEEIEAAQARLHEIELAAGKVRKIWTLGNHDCLDAATECLTRRGWKKHQEIVDSDEILSWVDGTAVWSRINEVVSFPFSGNLIRIEKSRLSMAVTPNHRVLLHKLNWRSKQYDIVEYRKAEDLPCSFNLPSAATIANRGASLSDDQIALAGWILTDGSYAGGGVSIYQSKPQGVIEIQGLLDRLGVKYSRYERQRKARAICGRALLKEPLPSRQFFIQAESCRQIMEWLPCRGHLPKWALDLNNHQFGVFLNALVLGDGVWGSTVNPHSRSCCVIYGMEPILSDIQAIAVCHGWRARLVVDSRGDPRLYLAFEPKLRIEKPQVFEEPYNGVVWCLRVPHGNFMVRRNGTAYFTGNSRYETRLGTVAPEFAKVHGIRLKDHFPLWEPAWSAWINADSNHPVVIKHRFKGGLHAPHNNTLWAGCSMVTGHLHSARVVPFTDYGGTRYGVDTGCLADPDHAAFFYLEDSPKNWRSAFAVLTFCGGMLMQPELVLLWDAKNIEFRGKTTRV